MAGILKQIYTLEALEKIALPAYKGSTFHGGFGNALAAISPAGFYYFFKFHEATPGIALNPYLLTPPLDTQLEYEAGEQFTLELTLLGVASKEHALCYRAIEYLGGELGLGYRNGRYRIADFSQQQYSDYPQRTNPTQSITLNFPTRLRFKTGNKFCRSAPNFELLCKRLHERAKRLNELFQSPKSPLDHDPQIEAASKVRIAHHNLKWDDWSRYSRREQQWLKFGGLTGSIAYQGDLTPYIPLLNLGEWLHLGSKSSFGLGKYVLTARN